MTRIFLTSSPEFENITINEIKELSNHEAIADQGVCIIDTQKLDIASKLTFYSQSTRHVSIYIGEIPISEELTDERLKSLCNEQLTFDRELWKQIASQQQSFAVRAEKQTTHQVSTMSFERIIGERLDAICHEENLSCKVDLQRPEIPIHLAITDSKIYIGVDLVGFDLSKRPYRLFSTPSAMNSSFAYYLLRFCGFEKNMNIVDPFCGTGTIPIEAALYSQGISAYRVDKTFSGFRLGLTKEQFEKEQELAKKQEITVKNNVSGYDTQLKNVLGAQKNAKIAGVKDAITLSKVDVEWIDAKFEENEVDLIITDPPKLNKRAKNEKDIHKIYDEVFYQAKYILKKNGRLCILVVKEEILIDLFERHEFVIEKKHIIKNKEQEYLLFIFKKK